MADTDIPDPLAGWTPSAVIAQPDIPDPLAAQPKKGILDTSYQQVPSTTNGGGIQWAPEVQRIIGAAREAYESSPPALTYDAREALKGPRPADAVGPFIADLLSTGKADLSALGAGAQQFVTELMGGTHVPASLQRDINLGVPAVLADVGVSNATAPVGPFHPADAPVMREMMQPPTPTLSDVYRGPLSTPDPVTASAIDILRRGTQPTTMPQPPEPFKPVMQPPPGGGLLRGQSPPVAQPGGGLLGVQSGATPIIPADEMLARSQAAYNPADKAAAQGATINPAAADKLRGVLTDAVPTDPQKAIGVGNTPLIQLGKDYQPFQGQPITYDAAMTLDQRLTQEKWEAAKAGNSKLAGQIGDAQDAFREKLENLGPDDTSGDASTLANLPQARQAYLQYRKQSQLDDIQYNASLLPEDKQDAYKRSQVTSMLRNDNKMRGWSDDERAALETQLKSGNIGSLTNFGLGLFKPAGKAVGAFAGSPFGVAGSVVGGDIGGELGAQAAARLRARLSQMQLDPVARALSANMPPPPAGWQPQP